jgi:hypothetical protein
MDVLWENPKGPDWQGLTDNYIRITAPSLDDLRNRIRATQMIELTKHGLRGRVKSPTAQTGQ